MIGREKRERIRRKVLLPLTMTLVFFLGLFLLVSYVYLQKNIRRDLGQQYKTADILLRELVDQRADLMNFVIRQITADRQLQAAMAGGRRQDLLRMAGGWADDLSRHGLTHFYFHTPEGSTFLRIHQPEFWGDPVDRETFSRAKRTLAPAQGIELGSLGTFSLRVVVPWFVDGNLIGFVELGEDLEYLIRKLHQIAPFDIVVFLRKSMLDRSLWEEGMRMLGRVPEWELFPDRVKSFHSLRELPPDLVKELAQRGFWSRQEIALEVDGRFFRGRLLPLTDVSQRRVGEILVLRDVSRAVESFRQSMSLVILFCLLFGGSFFASAFFLLGRTDRQLTFARRQLTDEIERAHQANQRLELEVLERRQAEAALKEARDLLEIRVRERTAALDLQNKLLNNLISHIPFHVYWKDRHLHYQGCNPAFFRLVEMDPESRILGMSDADLPWSAQQREGLSRLEETVVSTGKPVLGQEFVKTGPQGRETIFQVNLVPLKDSIGKMTGLLGIFKDITDRKRREEELQQALADARRSRDRLATLVRSVDDILFAVDAEEKLLLMNPSAELFFGIRMGQAVGRTLEAVISNLALRQKVKAAISGRHPGQFDLEVENRGVPRGSRILQARTSVLGDQQSGFEGMIFLVQDVTQERTMDRLKSDFISTAAHELRTPMAVILGYSELLLHESELVAEQQREFLSVIYERADAVSSLLDDLLDISRIESGQPLALHRDMVPVSELFGRTVEHYRKSVPSHQFELVLEEENLQLEVDRGKIWQVTENLVSNAVKYSPDGGSIRIRGRQTDTGYQVTVQDEGIGMTPEQVRQVFQKFYRADNSNTAIHGTGLGLTIVKHIIDAHGGRIWIESEPGKGTRVNLLLPADCTECSVSQRIARSG